MLLMTCVRGDDLSQISIDDIIREEELRSIPGCTAFIDECGSFGFDFSKDGTSKYYILCAVIVKNADITQMEEVMCKVKGWNGFAHTEMKSSLIGNNYGRRSKILSDLLPIPFRVILLVADKQAFMKDSALATYKQSFIKYLHQRLYRVLYNAYPKLRIIEDQIGTTEFQVSFKKYVQEHRPQSLLGEYEFDYSDSKNSLLVQLADFIGGTISKSYTDTAAPNYLESLKGKIICTEQFPNENAPYFGHATVDDQQYDNDIYTLAAHRARSFIDQNEQNDDLEKKLQVALLKYLLFYAQNIDARKYVSSHQLLSILEEYAGHRVRPNYLYRRIVAPLRDDGVILASSAHGYKLPISVKDVVTYFNQTHMIVSPMLHRMELCRKLIKQQTHNGLDILDDPAFVKYKRYFD